MSEKEIPKRNVNFDILRVLACVLIVLAHVSSETIYAEEPGSLNWIIVHLYNSLGHTGTILFLFLSGALLLPETYDFRPRKFYLNHFLKLFTAYYSWVVIYHIIGFIGRGQYSAVYFKDVIINVITGDTYYHFWYLPMLLGIYLLLPALRAICQGGKNLLIYLTVLFIIVQLGFSTIQLFEFPHKYLFVSLMNRIPFTLINHYAGYFFMGYLLTLLLKDHASQKRLLRIISVILIVSGNLLGLLGDYILSLQLGYNTVSFNEIFSVTMCMSAAGFFMLLNLIPTSECSALFSEALRKTTPLCFGVYIIHPLIWDAITDNGWLSGIFLIFRIPIRTCLCFGITILITWLLSKIPVVRQWVIYAGKSQDRPK
ncbi:MAG: acyltransferase family protein [Lachnospiraceae bacterium]|nr:acyltransferase family protein [Lachnospiraceae bacterium]